MSNEPIITGTAFLTDVKQIIDTARSNATRSVNFCRVQMYWNIGQRIFEEEQQGKERADYGTYLIKSVAQTLEPKYRSGFSYRQLAFCRQFYRLYPIVNALRSQLDWTQYRMLIQIGFVVIELKTGKLTHQDLGQLQMYVNYYDHCEKLSDKNSTIGILLGTSKNNTAVKMTLPEGNKTILANEYKLYLPTQA